MWQTELAGWRTQGSRTGPERRSIYWLEVIWGQENQLSLGHLVSNTIAGKGYLIAIDCAHTALMGMSTRQPQPSWPLLLKLGKKAFMGWFLVQKALFKAQR